jgi:hypothetical protein
LLSRTWTVVRFEYSFGRDHNSRISFRFCFVCDFIKNFEKQKDRKKLNKHDLKRFL